MDGGVLSGGIFVKCRAALSVAACVCIMWLRGGWLRGGCLHGVWLRDACELQHVGWQRVDWHRVKWQRVESRIVGTV